LFCEPCTGEEVSTDDDDDDKDEETGMVHHYSTVHRLQLKARMQATHAHSQASTQIDMFTL